MAEEEKGGLSIILFTDQAAWEAWLKLHHGEIDGVWLKIAKKGAKTSSVNYDQALESALCYGWIDSQIAAYDVQYYLHKFSPRRPKSKWSKNNCQKAEALIAVGRMQPAGLRQVELAKADGRWEAAYDSPSHITVPDDLRQALEQNPQAHEFFDQLNSTNRFAILYRLQDARRPATRAARLHKFVEMMASHKKIYP